MKLETFFKNETMTEIRRFVLVLMVSCWIWYERASWKCTWKKTEGLFLPTSQTNKRVLLSWHSKCMNKYLKLLVLFVFVCTEVDNWWNTENIDWQCSYQGTVSSSLNVKCLTDACFAIESGDFFNVYVVLFFHLFIFTGFLSVLSVPLESELCKSKKGFNYFAYLLIAQ